MLKGRLKRAGCHGRQCCRMNKLVQVVLVLLALALLLQAAVYIKSSPLRKTAPLQAAVPDRSLVVMKNVQVEEEFVGLSADEAGVNAEQRNAGKNGSKDITLLASTSRGEKESKVVHRHHHHTYPFVMAVPEACSNSSVDPGKSPRPELVIVVVSAVANFEERQSVRDTWGSYAQNANNNVSLVFLVGRQPGSPSLQPELEKESRRYGDIVQGDFVDSYRNLSVKTVALLQWITQFCAHSTYVLKADDDMYINVPNLLSALRKEFQAHSVFVMGHVFEGAVPVQNKLSKWYTPLEQFGEKVYPRYTSGTAYSMTTAAAKRLYEATAQVPLFWLEDIYITGLCARSAKVPVVHHAGFRYRLDTDACLMRRTISSHKVSVEQKRKLFKEMYDPEVKCKSTVASRARHSRKKKKV